MCAVRHLPVTDVRSVHSFGTMDDKRRSPSPQRRREETYPVRNTLPSKQSSRENIEYPPRLQETTREIGSDRQDSEQQARRSPSPRYPSPNPQSGSPSFQRVQQNTSRSDSFERGQLDRSSSYAPSASSQSDIPSGQVCRYVVTY